ncbi:MAG: extradiol dioxygenase [Chloroflexi bacterium 13_1_40CM_4_68_4]|nr:MAG: extradiol dioxygenase [Chloroflexi bacterium 13_1_40CM_4_68_4]
MISGAHLIIYSTDPEADRSFLRDVLALPNVDTGDGWLIFGLPPAEVAVHPSNENGRQQLYFICDDVSAFVAAMRRRNIDCEPVQDQGWGLLTQFHLPSGAEIGVYQPKHARPPAMGAQRKSAGDAGPKATRPRTRRR